ARPNVGPAITDVKHSPVSPVVNQAVTVVARVHDSDGLATLLLKYRVDPSTNLNVITMANNGAGLFSAAIPGQTAGKIAAFHVQASDNFSPSAETFFPDDDPLLGETDATLQWPGNGGGDNSYQREQTAYWIANQIGLPYCYRRHINLFVNGVRRAEMFEDVQQPNGDMTDEFYPDGATGDLHKVQLWFEFDDAASTFSPNGATLQKFTTTGGQMKLARYRWTFAKRAVHGSASN